MFMAMTAVYCANYMEQTKKMYGKNTVSDVEAGGALWYRRPEIMRKHLWFIV
jgi:hypothetical protein